MSKSIIKTKISEINFKNLVGKLINTMYMVLIFINNPVKCKY